MNGKELQLPSLLTCNDGTPVRTPEDWISKRRPEVLETLRREEYGRLPDMSDVAVRFRVTSIRKGTKIMAGQAVRKSVELTAQRGDRQFSFTFDIFIPASAKKPVPAFIEICNRGPMNCDPAREILSHFYPAETIVSRGYACCAFRTHEVAPDYEEGFHAGFWRLFPEFSSEDPADAADHRPFDAMGTISAWAWAASRILDYFETDPDIDEKRVAVVGHSRGGKTALWCGAQDERFAMAVSSCSGNSGDAISRGKTGESIRQILDRFPFWFARNYQNYIDRESEMPFDQHFLISLMAPRLVYTSTKTNDAWADPASEFKSLVHASPVYELFGLTGIEQKEMSLPEQPLHQGQIGHHHKTGDHDMDDYDWDQYIRFADLHMI